MNVAYEVKVIKMLDFGAVVEYLEAPGNEVLHVSELAWERTENVSDEYNRCFPSEILRYGSENKKRKVSRKHLCQDLHVRKEKSNQILVY
jgi:polyribonucleotide nucleotidyltransferase